MSTALIIITIFMQIVAKKAISAMFDFYMIVQVLLLISLKCCVSIPASSWILLYTIEGIVNLSAFDKKSVIEYLKLPQNILQEDSLLANMGGISLIAILLLILLPFIFIVGYFLKSPKGKQILAKVKKILFWNFLIRYLKVAFLNFNYSALISVMKTTNQMETISSSSILVVVYSLVTIIFYILLSRPLFYLNLQSTRDSIGNLYPDLNCLNRSKVIYGVAFFIQRLLIVIAICTIVTFGMQWTFVYLVVFFTNVYLFVSKPYSNWRTNIADYLNMGALLVLVIFWLSISNLITNTQHRYNNGIVFDVMCGIAFLLNVALVFYRSANILKLKIAKAIFRFKLRQSVQKRIKEKKDQERIKQEAEAQNLQEIEMQRKKEHIYNLYKIGVDNQQKLWLEKVTLAKDVPRDTEIYKKPIPIYDQTVTPRVDSSPNQSFSLLQLNYRQTYEQRQDQFNNKQHQNKLEKPQNFTQRAIQPSQVNIEKIQSSYTPAQQKLIQLQNLHIEQENKQVQSFNKPTNHQDLMNVKVKNPTAQQSAVTDSQPSFIQVKQSAGNQQIIQENKEVRREFEILSDQIKQRVGDQQNQPSTFGTDQIEQNKIVVQNIIAENRQLQKYQSYVQSQIKNEYQRHIKEIKQQQRIHNSVTLQDESQDQKESRYFKWSQKLPSEVKMALSQDQIREDWFEYDYEMSQKRMTAKKEYQK